MSALPITSDSIPKTFVRDDEILEIKKHLPYLLLN